MKRHRPDDADGEPTESPADGGLWSALLPELRGEVRGCLDRFSRRLLRLVSKRDATDDVDFDAKCPLGPYSALVEGAHWHVAVALWPAAVECLRATLQRKYQIELTAETTDIVDRVSARVLVRAAVRDDQLALVQDMCRGTRSIWDDVASKALRLGRAACAQWLLTQANMVAYPFRPHGRWLYEALALCPSRELLEITDAALTTGLSAAERHTWLRNVLSMAARTGKGRAWTAFAYVLGQGIRIMLPSDLKAARESPDPDIRRYAEEYPLSLHQ
jgi:hypothetical protein